jgi:hypothetical protein
MNKNYMNNNNTKDTFEDDLNLNNTSYIISLSEYEDRKSIDSDHKSL